MRAALLTFLACSYALPVLCQTSRSTESNVKSPVLSIHYYVNNKEKQRRVKAKDITLWSRTHRYLLRDSAGLLLLPFVAKNDTLDLSIKLGRQSFSMERIPGWRLQPGATVWLGQIDDFNKVVSIAKEDKMLPTEADYAVLNSRYRLADYNVIDLPDTVLHKQVKYIIINGYGQGTLLESWWVASK
ncbi:hypothetical protein [Hymenobacter cellulosilyticus]|uniref:DUF4390 domain-containing protein n=1 Tax=Hymenobacter cellulosilyticus TaxID=2932248 RepID=A0A8T9QEK2_9BACT|nr:hypothetical protein [Hymenobacter cellulosilyticus]UOQ73979.1 hypothetical protein MUN79_08805 [Hymenobacter cellulosilyticus]